MCSTAFWHLIERLATATAYNLLTKNTNLSNWIYNLPGSYWKKALSLHAANSYWTENGRSFYYFCFSIQIGLEKNFERRCYLALDHADSNKKAEEYFLKPSDTVLDILYCETWHEGTWYEDTWYEDTWHGNAASPPPFLILLDLGHLTVTYHGDMPWWHAMTIPSQMI